MSVLNNIFGCSIKINALIAGYSLKLSLILMGIGLIPSIFFDWEWLLCAGFMLLLYGITCFGVTLMLDFINGEWLR